MVETSHTDICLVIDVKKSRFRIYKSALHLLGDPKLIQLLFNPETRVVVIKSVDHTVPGGQELKVLMSKQGNGGSFEFYSKSLISQMCDVDNRLMCNCTYRMLGEVIPSERLARFSMNTMARVMEGHEDDEA